jgi:hypothetical protein
MRCAEFELRLNDVLDQRRWLDSDLALAEHARRCQPCASLAASYEAMIHGLEQAKIPEASCELSARVLAALAPTSSNSDRPDVVRGSFAASQAPLQSAGSIVNLSHWRLPLAGFALAASVMVAVAIWKSSALPAPAVKLGPSSLAAHGHDSPVKSAAAPDPAASGEATMPDPYRELAEETTQSLVTAMKLFPRVRGAAEEPTSDALADPASAWVHGVSDGLKPVTRTTAGAVNSFFELLAGGGEGSSS